MYADCFIAGRLCSYTVQVTSCSNIAYSNGQPKTIEK